MLYVISMYITVESTKTFRWKIILVWRSAKIRGMSTESDVIQAVDSLN